MTTLNAGFATTSFTPDRLLYTDEGLVPRNIVLLSGQVAVRGAVLGGKAVSATVAAAVPDAGNTGNGVFGTPTAGADVRNGTYRVVILDPATNAGSFAVYGPDGIEVGQGTVGVAFAGPIHFTLADGSTDFASGDAFSVAVSAAVIKYALSAAAGTDGTEVPDLILAIDTDATAGDVATVAYEAGTFIDAALTLGAGHTIASIREGLRRRGIHLVSTVGA
jgi:hypothetical protein